MTLNRKPRWLSTGIPLGENYTTLKKSLRQNGLHTVCEQARCPNLAECWGDRTATLMILGDTCTRACRFCHVKTGNPRGRVNEQEIANSVKTVGLMNLRYVVITSVDRDDLPDFGAGHFGQVVQAIGRAFPETKVEVLVPDFKAHGPSMMALGQSGPFVIAQNLETVRRLTRRVRDRRATYAQTLRALAFYREHFPKIPTKSSLMVGLGETEEELQEAMEELRSHGVSILTMGQYLRPSRRHLPVEKFYTPGAFRRLKEYAYGVGFDFVAAGPLVRSSYKARAYLDFLDGRADSH